MAERARIVLACLRGSRNDEVAREVGVRPNTVGVWRRRFAERGIAGLCDDPRSGKPAKYGPELRDRILRQLESPPPAGMASWDGGSLAQALGASDDAVWRVLRKEGIQLQRHRSWCVSTDPQFAAKAADVIGLYLKPARERLGAQRRREALDSSARARTRLCSSHDFRRTRQRDRHSCHRAPTGKVTSAS